jgi:hypothetical protein
MLYVFAVYFVTKQTSCGHFYLSFTSLSAYGLRGRLFIISDSDSSYAREMAGT